MHLLSVKDNYCTYLTFFACDFCLTLSQPVRLDTSPNIPKQMSSVINCSHKMKTFCYGNLRGTF